MLEIMNAAWARWGQSIIDKKDIDDLFSFVEAANEEDVLRLEAAKLVLVDETKKFVWMMFDERLQKRDLKFARRYFDRFQAVVSRATYRAPSGAIRMLDAWLREEEKANIENHRSPSAFDMSAYPWLIAFFRVVFEQPAGTTLPGKDSLFIESYFGRLSDALNPSRITVLDPERRGRCLRKPSLVKTTGAVRLAIAKHAPRADQYAAIIGVKIDSLVAANRNQSN